MNVWKLLKLSQKVYYYPLIKTASADSNLYGHSSKMKEGSTPSNRYSDMSGYNDKCKKIYADCANEKSKPTFLIHGPSHYSER